MSHKTPKDFGYSAALGPLTDGTVRVDGRWEADKMAKLDITG